MKKKQKLQDSILSDSVEYGDLTRKNNDFTTATATTATTGDETNSAVQNLQQVTPTLSSQKSLNAEYSYIIYNRIF